MVERYVRDVEVVGSNPVTSIYILLLHLSIYLSISSSFTKVKGEDMKLHVFIEEIKERVSEVLGEDYEVSLKKVLKNNSVEFDCLIITHRFDNVSPSIYLNSFYLEYLNGVPMETLVDGVIATYKNCLEQFDRSKCSLIDTEHAEEHIVLRLVNYARNIRILEECPHIRCKDLALIYHYMLSDDNSDGLVSVRIDYSNMAFFKLTEEKLKEKALENTERLFPPVFEKVEYLMKEYCRRMMGNAFTFGDERFADMFPMYVLTSKSRMNGAVCMLYKGMLERIKKTLGKGFYIIPSSINEILILPESYGMNQEDLAEMVQSVNYDIVPETEVLSDSVYHYPDDELQLF